MNADDVRRVVYSLRRLIGDDRRKRPLIRTRRGYGYVLEVPAPALAQAGGQDVRRT
jgi:DNA-binding winged helix-turn-helix (wHTH) protein